MSDHGAQLPVMMFGGAMLGVAVVLWLGEYVGALVVGAAFGWAVWDSARRRWPL